MFSFSKNNNNKSNEDAHTLISFSWKIRYGNSILHYVNIGINYQLFSVFNTKMLKANGQWPSTFTS